MLKKELRLNYTQLRNKTSQKDISDYSIKIANNLLELPIWGYDFYHIFLPITEKKEINTNAIITILQGKDKNIVLPKMDKDTLTHFLLTDSTLIIKNKWNIPEPSNGIEVLPNKIDVVFIPLLAFDIHGNRVGYGKGYYDTFLTACRPEVIKIGLSLFEASEKITDVYKGDVPLDYCVTPNNIYKF